MFLLNRMFFVYNYLLKFGVLLHAIILLELVHVWRAIAYNSLKLSALSNLLNECLLQENLERTKINIYLLN